MNPVLRIWGRVTELFTIYDNPLARTFRTFTRRPRSVFMRPTYDWGRSDYDYWRRVYYCRARGLELSGLFVKTLTNKLAAWMLGRAPTWKMENEASAAALADWWNANHPRILRTLRGAIRQGDGFLVINSDLTITLLPPDTVDPIVDEADYGRVIGWRVTQTLTHPEQLAARMTVVDEYYPDRRIHRVEINAVRQSETVFPNLLGRLPIVHLANQPDDGETFGHAEAEPLIEVMHRYGSVFEAAIEGNILQGRPTPHFNFATIQDMDAFWERFATSVRQTLPDGTTEATNVLDLDLSQALTTSSAEFEYKSPGQFTEDTVRLLELMFYLILEHTEIPEFVMGNAISSSKASAETQLPVFVRYIEMRRGEIAGWLTEIAEIALGYLALVTPGVSTIETPRLDWEDLTTQDGKLTLETLKWAHLEGLLPDKLALMLAPINVENVGEAIAEAKEEQAEREAKQQEQAEAQMDRQLQDEIENLEI